MGILQARIDPLAVAQSPAKFTGEDVQQLQASLSEDAKVATENDSEYAQGIRRWSKAAEKFASIVVFPKTPEDVSKAVLFSVKHKLELAVCSGGHSTSGASSTLGGLCINLMGMRRVSVDVEKKIVTAEGGALWKDVDTSAGRLGLAVVGGTVNHTGVGGLTLGGGYSYLTPTHGLTIDNLLEVEFVLADGKIANASATQNLDLFWAARGAGTSFGVATKFTYRAHSQPNNIWAGKLIFDGISAFAPVMEFANSLMEKNDKKSWMFVGSGHMPPHPEKPSIVCICFYNGTYEEGMSVFGPLTKLDYKLYSHVCEMPYYEMNGFINEGLDHGQRRSMTGCAFIPSPANSRDIAWDSFKPMKQFVERCPDAAHSFVLLEFIPFDKICEVPQTATAFANRGAYCNLLYIMTWNKPENDHQVRDFVREQVRHARGKFEEDRARLRSEGNIDMDTLTGVGEYFNHDTNDAESDGRAAFGPNYDRLVTLKKIFDPENVFCKGPKLLRNVQNVQNGGSSSVG